MRQQTVKSGRRQELRFWSEVITAQLEAWEPRVLPATFRPRPAPDGRDRRLLPILAAVVVMLLVAVVFLARQPRDLVKIVVDIGQPHPSVTSAPAGTTTRQMPRSSHPAAHSPRPSPSPAGPQSTSASPTPPPPPGPAGPAPGASAAPGLPDVPVAPFIPSPVPSAPDQTPTPSPLPVPSVPVDTPPLPSLPPASPPDQLPPVPLLPSPPDLDLQPPLDPQSSPG